MKTLASSTVAISKQSKAVAILIAVETSKIAKAAILAALEVVLAVAVSVEAMRVVKTFSTATIKIS